MDQTIEKFNAEMLRDLESRDRAKYWPHLRAAQFLLRPDDPKWSPIAHWQGSFLWQLLTPIGDGRNFTLIFKDGTVPLNMHPHFELGPLLREEDRENPDLLSQVYRVVGASEQAVATLNRDLNWVASDEERLSITGPARIGMVSVILKGQHIWFPGIEMEATYTQHGRRKNLTLRVWADGRMPRPVTSKIPAC